MLREKVYCIQSDGTKFERVDMNSGEKQKMTSEEIDIHQLIAFKGKLYAATDSGIKKYVSGKWAEVISDFCLIHIYNRCMQAANQVIINLFCCIFRSVSLNIKLPSTIIIRMGYFEYARPELFPIMAEVLLIIRSRLRNTIQMKRNSRIWENWKNVMQNIQRYSCCPIILKNNYEVTTNRN